MLYQIVRESEQGNIPVSFGTHHEMWVALRQIDPNQINHFVEPCPTTTLLIGGTREAPKMRNLKASNFFPGVKKCFRRCQIRTARQAVRLSLRQFLTA